MVTAQLLMSQSALRIPISFAIVVPIIVVPIVVAIVVPIIVGFTHIEAPSISRLCNSESPHKPGSACFFICIPIGKEYPTAGTTKDTYLLWR